MQLFDGKAFAAQIEDEIEQQIAQTDTHVKPQIGVVLFTDDAASCLYSRLKREAAQRVGVGFLVKEFGLNLNLEEIFLLLQVWASDPQVTGMMIQKPSVNVWQLVTGQGRAEFAQWWQNLVEHIDPSKDVDGLHPSTLEAIKLGDWQQQGKVLPATAQAVLDILDESPLPVSQLSGNPALRVAMLGRSEIVGLPVYYVLKNLGVNIELLGQEALAQRKSTGQALLDFDVIIAATGKPGLVTGHMVKDGVVLIDVGEPKADFDFDSVSRKAEFLTPVPGGVGPVTVAALLHNAWKMVSQV